MQFTKMHGLGNDFVVIDAIKQSVSLSAEQIRFIADRQFGIGCDQLLLVEAAPHSNADFRYRIFNADGDEVSQCGNGARCFARFVRDKKLSRKHKILVDTNTGQLLLHFVDNDQINVDMGIPQHAPVQIPLAVQQEAQQYSVSINDKEIMFAAVSMGNPHAVIEVDDIDATPVNELGPLLENHPIFPARANIGFMQIVDRQHIRLRVFERGSGETLACGSGACAAVVTGVEQQLLAEQVRVELPGGTLDIRWQGRSYSVFMRGPAISVFEGNIEL